MNSKICSFCIKTVRSINILITPIYFSLFQQLAIQDQSPEHAQIYRFFVFKLAKDYDHQSYSKRKEENRSLDSIASSGDLTNLIEAINKTHGMEISDEDPIIKKYMNQHDSNYRSFIRYSFT